MDPVGGPTPPAAVPGPSAGVGGVDLGTPIVDRPEVAGAELGRLPRTGIDPGLLLMLGGVMFLSGVMTLRYADDRARR